MKIQAKLLVLTFIVTTLVLTSFAAYYVWRQNQLLRQELDQLTQAVAERFASQVALALWNVDDVQIKDALLAEMSERRILNIVVRDEDKSSVYAAVARTDDWQPLLIATAPAPGAYHATRPVSYNAEEVGLVEVNLSDRFLTAQTQAIIKEVAIGVAVLNLALLLSLFLALRYLIVRPLSTLKGQAEAIASGNFGVQIANKSHDEIGQVGQAIELLKTSLKIAMERLRH